MLRGAGTNKISSLKIMEGLAKLAIKHKDEQAVPLDKGLERFDCKGQLLLNEEEDNEDSNDGERSEDQDTVASEAVATGEQNIIPQAATKAITTPIMLADLCEDDSDLILILMQYFLINSGSLIGF